MHSSLRVYTLVLFIYLVTALTKQARRWVISLPHKTVFRCTQKTYAPVAKSFLDIIDHPHYIPMCAEKLPRSGFGRRTAHYVQVFILRKWLRD